MAASALRRVPVWIWLATLVTASAVFRAALAGGIKAPFIMIDEIVWAELARGIADSGKPLIRGVSHPGYGVVYPLVISPAYVLFDRLPSAYAAVKDLNAVVMSLAAIPAYLLARRVVRPPLALLAALLTLAVPSLAYTGTVMTENLFYPLFLLVSLVLALVLERPSPLRVVSLLALFAIAFGTRVQAVALVPAALLAPLLLAFFRRERLQAALVRNRYLYGGFAAVGLAALSVQLAAGRSLQDLLGAYSPVSNASYDLGDVLRYLAWHVEELVLYLLVVPVAAVVILLGRARTLEPRLQSFLAAVVALTVSFVPIVAVFASHFSGGRIEERNLFYLAPLFLIALLAWIEIGAPRPPVLTAAALGGCVLLVLLLPFHRFLTTSAITDTLMLLPWWSLQDHVGADWIRPLAGALVVALSALFLLVPRRYALALPAVVLVLWGVALKPIWWGTHGFERFSRGALFQGIRAKDPDWIDRSLPGGAEAAFVWTGRTDWLTVSENEFFNETVGPVYDTGEPTPGGLPETRIQVNPKSGLVTLPGGERVDVPYVVSDSSFEPDGRPVARDSGWGITVWRIAPPLISAVRIDGLYPNDTWSGRTATWTRRRCVHGLLLASVSSDPSLFFRSQTIVARTNAGAEVRVRLQPNGQSVLRVPLTPTPESTCRVVFTVTPTAVPQHVDPQSSDRRVLGAHFNRFLYQRKSG